MFHCYGVAAGWREDIQIVLPKPASQRYVERLHEHRSHVAAHPLVKDGDEEAAELRGANRALGDQVSVLRIQWPVRTGPIAPAQIGKRQESRGGPLHNGDKLHVS